MGKITHSEAISIDRSGDDRLAFSPIAAARMIGIGRTMLYELIDRGELKSFRVGVRRLITRRAIEQFIAEREARP